jgi:hypothetical protein
LRKTAVTDHSVAYRPGAVTQLDREDFYEADGQSRAEGPDRNVSGALGHLLRKLQRSLDGLEARLVAQWIEQPVRPEDHEARIAQSQRLLEPVERCG